MRKKVRQRLATAIGFSTTIVTALVLIDFDAINWHSVNDWLKILVALLPAAGGYLSEVSEKIPKTDAPV